MGETGVAVKGAQLNARGSLGVEGEGLRTGESQGAAESLVEGEERPKWDWIQSRTNLMGQTEAGRGGGEGLKSRKVEGQGDNKQHICLIAKKILIYPIL